MDSTTRDRLHALVLKARPLLIGEARDLLEGVYGLGKDGRFAPAASVPPVQMLPEVGITRIRLETFLTDETAAGLTAGGAVEKLVKEVAFTHLNRLVAFKMLESRKLVRGTIDKYHNSNAFAFYRADHPDEEARYQAGSLPQNLLGEGPRDIAYRHFLLAQCAEMAAQIRVLFDPDNLPSRLFPRPHALEALINLLNDPEVQDSWKDDATIGWVYQYFNELEKADIFERLLKKKQKIRQEDIPAATQLFTPRWIVSWLVMNTLGRYWIQMHPDSRLAEQMEYLVPLGGEIPRVALKKVREIETLDPACGTMQFGLVAFDLFVEMYQEEIEKAGAPGWPAEPSVSTRTEIASSIVKHNLFGIDIDLRAVQLSALTLYLKAKSIDPSTEIRDSNLACADILPLDGVRLDVFLNTMQFPRPIYERIIRGLWSRLRGASYAGSLVRLEEDIRDLIARERDRYRLEGVGRLPFPELREVFEEGADADEFWTILESQVVNAFDDFARQQSEQGVDQAYFAGEANKGMRVLKLLVRRYDIVFTNPPYMGSRGMAPELADFLKSNYPNSKRDLYAAFIERCMELLADGGRLGMITQHSFMFIRSYEALRNYIETTTSIETAAHLGPRAFEDIAGEKASTAMFVLRTEPNYARRVASVGTYFRLLEGQGDDKRVAFQQALGALKAKFPGLRGLWAGIRFTREDLTELRKEMLREVE